ncbi:MAG: type IV pilus twitching motility protein PilT [Defluviitaleaceae bacterium]|nr:type IV pilus twitching motility protein PilT [Defluviitaleaceae bacterium]MCL2239077.1 type IV pilus twitching motility protein PilT [Defluviitaleaceae bacterium]
MTIADLMRTARERRASDIHLTKARNPIFRIDGTLQETEFALSPQEKVALILSMLGDAQREAVHNGQDVDMSYTIDDNLRHRVNIFHQQNALACVIRIINANTPTFEELNTPEAIRKLVDEPRGLILVTGPTGSGKSTTLAAMIDYINTHRACHILTVEDPVEYVYTQKKALIHQRDVGHDVPSFSAALRSAMREDPDVILVGEMRDYETISAAVTAAETGHLVLSTLHTTGAASTVDRIIDVFPPHNQQQIRTQLAAVLKGVITQTLVPKASGQGRVAAFEIMLGTDAVLNLIRENKGHQLNSTIQTGTKQGMVLLDNYLASLVRNGTIKLDAALEKVHNRAEFMSEVQRV